jgi:hypothetical protein
VRAATRGLRPTTVRSGRRVGLCLLTSAALLGYASVASAEPDFPPPLLSLLVLRALAHDHALAERIGPRANVAVLFNSDRPTSAACGATMFAALGKAAAKYSLSGAPVVVHSLPLADIETLATAVTSANLAVLFVCGGLEPLEMTRILAVAHQHKVRTITADSTILASGVGIGLVMRNDKPKIVVNLAASRAEGANLSADFLMIADVAP